MVTIFHLQGGGWKNDMNFGMENFIMEELIANDFPKGDRPNGGELR
jgi:hypothetical protein